MGRDRRHSPGPSGPGRLAHWLPTLLVLALLVAAFASYRLDLGPRYLPWLSVDPGSEPAAIAPPAGVALPPWTFVTKAGTPVNPANVRRAMLRVLKAAGLPQHFTPHCLRHTYASLLLADGVSPVYVQEQLGHATIELTMSTYGRWSLLSFLVIEDLRLNGIRQKQVVFTQHLGIGHTLDLILLTKLLSMLLMSPALPHGNNIFGPHITLPRKGKCLMSC